LTGNAATATTAGACTGNAATATTAGTCTGNAATATNANGLINTPPISVGTVSASGLVTANGGITVPSGQNLTVSGGTTLNNLIVTGTVTGISGGGGVSSNMSFSNVATTTLSSSSNVAMPSVYFDYGWMGVGSYVGPPSGQISLPLTFSASMTSAWFPSLSGSVYSTTNTSASFSTSSGTFYGPWCDFDLGFITTMTFCSMSVTTYFTNIDIYSSSNNTTWTSVSGLTSTGNGPGGLLSYIAFSGSLSTRYVRFAINKTTVRDTNITFTINLNANGVGGVSSQNLTINGPSGYLLDLTKDNARKLTTTTWTTGSDQRVKVNIEDADTQICYSNVKSLKLKRFAWDSNLYPSISDRNMLGWIAQDVKPFLPRSITYTDSFGFSDFHNLDTDQIIKSMYGALQQLMATTEEQGSMISKQSDMISKYSQALSNANIPIP
jgi:hypothetical protein